MIRDKLRRARDVLRHRGDAVECPVCGSRFDEFAPAWNRPNAICWRCGAHERHRALWLFLTEVRPDLLAGARKLLHFAPEHCLERRLQRLPGIRYVTGDIDPGKGQLRLDLLDLALEDESFDGVLCSHVLEHVPDDVQAMRELRRIITADGWCIVMVPIDVGRSETYEDPAITQPAERLEHFGQEDHVRLYSPDIEARLRAAGFAVDTWAPPEEWLGRHGLLRPDLVFCCRKG